MKSSLFYQRLCISCLAVLSLFCHEYGILSAQEGVDQEPSQPIAPPRTVLDPIAETVVQSLRYPEPTTPRGWLEAAIKAIDVDALADSIQFYRRFLDAVADVDRDDRNSVLADIGDSINDAHLHRLYRALAPYEPDAPKVIQSILSLSSQRKREPQQIEEALKMLQSDHREERLRALDQLTSAGINALPKLIALLQTTDTENSRARNLALGLIHNLGSDGRDTLLSWLGSEDREHWPGIITALSAISDEDTCFLLAPALAADSPPAAKTAANTSLAALGLSPTLREAKEILTLQLDRTLSPMTLPAGSTGLKTTVKLFQWNPTQGIPELTDVSMQNAQALRANHLARDLAALSPTSPKHITLVILARMTFLASEYSDDSGKLANIPPDEVMASIAGPQGYDPALAAVVLKEASSRGLIGAATVTAKAIRLGATNEHMTQQSTTQPHDTRDSLLSAMRLPYFDLQFEAAQALAICGGQPPYYQSTKVLETLMHAATSTGIDRAIVAHPDHDILEEMATNVSRFGYQPVRVCSSRDAILAARNSIDTTVILLAAKLDGLSTAETIRFLRASSTTASIPVLVIVDPLDDQPLGTFMTHLTISLRDHNGVAIVDRMESFFQPVTDASTGTIVRKARFITALSEASGYASSADRQWRRAQAASRRSRAVIALEQLAFLGEAGWDVSKAASIAQEALLDDDTHLAAVSFLSVLGTPVAQQTLYYEACELDLPATQRLQARDGFATSVRRNGILLESRHLLDLSTLYNKSSDPRNQQVASELFKILESHEIRFKNIPSDAQKDPPN